MFLLCTVRSVENSNLQHHYAMRGGNIKEYIFYAYLKLNSELMFLNSYIILSQDFYEFILFTLFTKARLLARFNICQMPYILMFIQLNL